MILFRFLYLTEITTLKFPISVVKGFHSTKKCAFQYELTVTIARRVHYISVLRKHLVIGQFSFSSGFLCFSLVTINRQIRMTPVSFVKTIESYEVCRFWSPSR